MIQRLCDLHEALTGYGFRTYATHAPDHLDRNGMWYWVSLDTDNLRETDRRRDQISDEVGIPSHVEWNGERYRFTLRVDSIRENTSLHHVQARTQVYDSGYTHEYSFTALNIAHELARQGYEWQDSKIGVCGVCDLRCPGGLPTRGTVVTPDSDDLCVRCALDRIGETDTLDDVETGLMERVVAGQNRSTGRIERVPNALYGHKTDLKERLRDDDVPSWAYNPADRWKWSARKRRLSDAKRKAGETPLGGYAAVFRVAVSDDDRFTSAGTSKRPVNNPSTLPDDVAERCRDHTRAKRWWFAVEYGPRGGLRDVGVLAQR